MKKTLVHLICMAALGITAAAHGQQTTNAAPKATTYKLPVQALTSEIMFRQLLADISFQRGLFTEAYQGYIRLAYSTKDPRYAELAYEVALIVGEREAVTFAATLLQQLAPNAKVGKEIIVGNSFEKVQKHYKEGNYQAAYDNLKEILAVTPDEPTALLMMGDVADELGKYTEARAALTRLVKVTPKDAEALNALGYFLAEQNTDLAKARGYIEHAHDLNPEAPHIIDSLAWVAYRQNRLDEAVEWISQVADSKQVEIQVHRGEILWVAKQPELAIAAFQKAHRLDQKNKTLTSTLKRLNIDPKTLK
jgi:tetratricopeptide (TPR) repeat protein